MKKLFCIFLAVLSLTGCAGMENFFAEQRVKTYAAADTVLLKDIYTVSADGKTQTVNPALTQAGFRLNSFQSTMITFKRNVAGGNNMEAALYEFKTNFPNATEEALAKQYVAAVKSRGNTAKLYKTTMSQYIAEMVGHPIKHFEGDSRNPASIEWYNLQPVIMEFDAQGRLVSLLLHVYQAQASFGAGVTGYSTIYFGRSQMAQIENRLGNRMLDNAFVRNL